MEHNSNIIIIYIQCVCIKTERDPSRTATASGKRSTNQLSSWYTYGPTTYIMRVFKRYKTLSSIRFIRQRYNIYISMYTISSYLSLLIQGLIKIFFFILNIFFCGSFLVARTQIELMCVWTIPFVFKLTEIKFFLLVRNSKFYDTLIIQGAKFNFSLNINSEFFVR